MDTHDTERTIRDLNDLIKNPGDRMSEVAIDLMVKLVNATIETMNEAMVQFLAENAHQLKTGKKEH